MTRTILTSPTDFFIRPDGNDANSGLVNSPSGAFLTANACANFLAANVDFAGFQCSMVHTGNLPVTITDPTQLLSLTTPVNFVGGIPQYIGDVSNPANVTLAPVTFKQACIQATYAPTALDIGGFTLAGNVGFGEYVSGGANVRVIAPMQYGNMFGSSQVVHHGIASGGKLFLLSNYSIINTMNIIAHCFFYHGGLVEFAVGLQISCSGGNPFTIFMLGATGGNGNGEGLTFPGGGMVTGQKFNIQEAIFDTHGTINFPGKFRWRN